MRCFTAPECAPGRRPCCARVRVLRARSHGVPDAVLDDWTRGTLGSGYAPECYEAAIDALPEDLRAYTTAADDITRAAITANRNEDVVATGSQSDRQLADTPAEGDELRSFPTEVAVLAGLLTVLFSCGLGAALLRRRRGR
jgi:hypothetical protein